VNDGRGWPVLLALVALLAALAWLVLVIPVSI